MLAIESAEIAVKKSMSQRRWPLSRRSELLARLSNLVRPVLRGCKWRALKPSALVVDDDPDIPPLVDAALGRFAICSDSAKDGPSAMARLRSKTYDMVILDLSMPGPTGFDVLQALKKDQRLRPIPVIVLTGNHSDEALARSFGYGADDFIAKPFKANELGMRAYRLLYPLAPR
jgi:two-component system, OmpR family, alkaline phosphatase synthesis response regulator PhoP